MDGSVPETDLAGPQHRPRRQSPPQPAVTGDTDGSAAHQHRRTAAHPPADATVPSLPEESTIRPTPPPAPALKPFYTVVSDVNPSSSSSVTHYPRVRYVFSDDDPDIISGTPWSDHALQSRDAPPSSVLETGDDGHDRSILLDLVPAPDGRGYSVAWASSLSPNWAVIDTRLEPLEPSSAGDAIDGEDARAMVLHIEGLSIPAASLSTSSPREIRRTSDGTKDGSLRADKATPRAKDYDDLVHAFEARMSLLRSAVRNSEARRMLTSDMEPN